MGSADSSLFYVPEQDEEIFVTVLDRVGRGGPSYQYRLHIKVEEPGFHLIVAPQSGLRSVIPSFPSTNTDHVPNGSAGAVNSTSALSGPAVRTFASTLGASATLEKSSTKRTGSVHGIDRVEYSPRRVGDRKTRRVSWRATPPMCSLTVLPARAPSGAM